jgi:hypothetical protein
VERDTKMTDYSIWGRSVTINDEYASLIPLLTSQEYDTLKNSIKMSNGNIVPITINQEFFNII